jgi:hypothetical protein
MLPTKSKLRYQKKLEKNYTTADRKTEINENVMMAYKSNAIAVFNVEE